MLSSIIFYMGEIRVNKEQYISSQLNLIQPKSTKKTRIAFIGFSSLSDFSFYDFFKENHLCLELVICYESDFLLTKTFLQESGYIHTKVFSIADKCKNKKRLSKELYSNLKAICNLLNISHFVLSSNFENISIFRKFILKQEYPSSICTDFSGCNDIKQLSSKCNKMIGYLSSNIAILNSYHSHLGYLYIRKLLNKIVNEYNVPISYISINAVMLESNLFETELINYYYFLSDIIKINHSILDNELRVRKSKIFDHRTSILKNKLYQEEDYTKLIHFYNRKKQVVSMANSHFSILPRHCKNKSLENFDIWIHVGTLMKIQIIVQGESKFDICVYRNKNILEGPEEEIVHLSDLYSFEKPFSLSQVNQASTKDYLKHFFQSKHSLFLEDNQLIFDLLSKSLEKKSKKQIFHFEDYFLDLDKIRKFSFDLKDDEKKLLKKQFIKNFKNFTAGIIMNNKLNSNQNEVYLYISNQDEIVSKLLYKTYQSKIKSNIYYFYLKLLLLTKNAESLFQYCTR